MLHIASDGLSELLPFEPVLLDGVLLERLQVVAQLSVRVRVAVREIDAVEVIFQFNDSKAYSRI